MSKCHMVGNLMHCKFYLQIPSIPSHQEGSSVKKVDSAVALNKTADDSSGGDSDSSGD